MQKRTILCTAVLFQLTFYGLSASANLIQNGDFEDGTYNNSPYNYAPNYVPVDWSVNTAFADNPFTNGDRAMPYTGSNDLQIGPGGNPAGSEEPTTIYQTLTDTPGATYTVDFFLYTTQGGNIPSPDCSFEAQINGSDGFDINGIPASTYRSYTEVSFPFTGTGSDTLTFAVTDTVADQPVWEIDDVSINPAPEPTVAALLAIGLGASIRRRR